MKTLFMQAGFYIEVTSWENDADYYRTKTQRCEKIEQAKFLLELSKKHSDCHSQEGGLGNAGRTSDITVKTIEQIVELFIEYKDVLNECYEVDLDGWDLDDIDTKLVLDTVGKITGDLFGYSEYYMFRVFDRARVYYVENDIYIDELISASRR